MSQNIVTPCGDVAGKWSIMGGVTNARGIRAEVRTIATGYHLSVFIQLSCRSHSLSATRKQWKLCSPTSQQMCSMKMSDKFFSEENTDIM